MSEAINILQNSLSLEKSLLNQKNLGIIRIDLEGKPLFINDYLLSLLKFNDFNEFLEYFSKDSEIRKNTNPDKYLNYLKSEIKNKFIESKWITKNGKLLFLKEFINPVYNENNQLVYIDSIIEDVTDIKIIDELIKNYQLRDLSILKAIPDLLFLISFDGVFLDFKYSSNNSIRIFSNPMEIIGKRVEEIFPNQAADLIINAVRNTLSDKQLQTVEFSLERDGKLSYYEARIIYNSDNQALILLRDISIQKQAQTELIKVKEDLEIANAEKDKFFSLIAHDLRTPLIGLTGYAEILAEDIDNLSKEEIKEYSSNIVEISRLTIKFLTNLLEWSRLQTGKIQYMPTDISINLIVQSIFQLLKSNASRKNIVLVNKTDPEHIAYADENMIYPVLNNLISNAIKFTNFGGEIIVSSRIDDNKIITSVKDNGVGMDDEQINNLFLLNKSFTTPGTPKEKGTGLGMILCRDFINKNFGKLWVSSKLGEGTEFSFSLPRYKS